MFQHDHFYSCRWLFLLCASLFVGLIVSNAAPRAIADDLTVAEFERLSEAEQIDYLKEALLEFRRKTANIAATVTFSPTLVEYDPASGRATNTVVMDQSLFQLRRIGDSYRIVGDREPSDPKPGHVYPTSIESYDAQVSQRRQLDIIAQGDQAPVYFGTIDTERGRVARDCFFFQYLGDDAISEDDYGTWFLDSIDKAKITQIDPETATVEVSFPYPDRGTGAKGICRVLFDLSKNALLTGAMIKSTITNPDGSTWETTSEKKLSDAEQVDGVWIPTKLRVRGLSSDYPNRAGIHEGTITDIKLNQLTPADLEVEFPPGTEVNDRITETRFRIGPDGKPIESTIRSVGAINATKGLEK